MFVFGFNAMQAQLEELYVENIYGDRNTKGWTVFVAGLF